MRFAAPCSSIGSGEIRDRSYENQRHRASGLNLLVRGYHFMEHDLFAACDRSTCVAKDTIRHPVIWPIFRHSVGSTSNLNRRLPLGDIADPRFQINSGRSAPGHMNSSPLLSVL